jgi:hypothetical protein
MRFYPKGFLAAGAAVFLLGLGLSLGEKPRAEGPPAFAERALQPPAQAQEPFPPVEALSGPWFRRPAAAAAPPSPKPAPAPAQPARVDGASVTFLGSFKDRNGAPSYFFKYLPSGQVMILRPGETDKGWTLQEISDKKFTLIGSGGRYEVPR